jgi:hypothetical protein
MTVVSFNTEATIHIPADDDGVTILKWNVIYDALTAMNRSQTSRYQEEEVGWLSCGQVKGTNTSRN